ARQGRPAPAIARPRPHRRRRAALVGPRHAARRRLRDRRVPGDAAAGAATGGTARRAHLLRSRGRRLLLAHAPRRLARRIRAAGGGRASRAPRDAQAALGLDRTPRVGAGVLLLEAPLSDDAALDGRAAAGRMTAAGPVAGAVAFSIGIPASSSEPDLAG